jgi:iron-sulfur cluster assembly accessory protein
MTVQNEATTTGVILTDTAASKVGALLEQEGRDDLRLRIAVQPGGCSGLRYQLYFDEREMDGDVDAEFSGVHVVTDKMSAPYLMGATIDFVDTIEKQGFTIDNPTPAGPAPAATRSTNVRGGDPPGPPPARRAPACGRHRLAGG